VAGEKVFPHSRAMTSVEWTAPGVVRKGDIVDTGGRLGFALESGKRGARIAVAIECDLVYVPQPSPALAWKAGESVGWHGGAAVKALPRHDHSIGIVHHDTPDTEDAVPVVWRSGSAPPGYSFYQALNPLTTPAFGLASVTTRTAIPDDPGALIYTLATTSTLGIRPGAPVCVDYEGDLLWTRPGKERKNNMEVSIGYQLWHDRAGKRATIWRRSFRDSFMGDEIGISMDSFSNHSILDIGIQIPNDRSTSDNQRFTTVSAADFDDGIPVKILLRFRGFSAGDLNKRQKAAYLNPIHLLHPQVVTYQIGGRI